MCVQTLLIWSCDHGRIPPYAYSPCLQCPFLFLYSVLIGFNFLNY